VARQQLQEEDDPVVAAIERVLKVERDGAQQLERGREQAKQLLDQARAQAAAIAARSDACISRLYGSYLQKVQHDIEKLEQSSRSLGAQPDETHERAVLIEAVRRVAAKLTGGA